MTRVGLFDGGFLGHDGFAGDFHGGSGGGFHVDQGVAGEFDIDVDEVGEGAEDFGGAFEFEFHGGGAFLGEFGGAGEVELIGEDAVGSTIDVFDFLEFDFEGSGGFGESGEGGEFIGFDGPFVSGFAFFGAVDGGVHLLVVLGGYAVEFSFLFRGGGAFGEFDGPGVAGFFGEEREIEERVGFGRGRLFLACNDDATGFVVAGDGVFGLGF